MKAWIPLMLAFSLVTAVHAQQDECVYPHAPSSTPDGNTATKEQMIAGKHEFDRYNTEMNAYLDCLKLKTDALTPKDPTKLSPEEKQKVDEQIKILIQKNNAAVDELQAAVGHFNDQIKLYKAKHP